MIVLCSKGPLKQRERERGLSLMINGAVSIFKEEGSVWVTKTWNHWESLAGI